MTLGDGPVAVVLIPGAGDGLRAVDPALLCCNKMAQGLSRTYRDLYTLTVGRMPYTARIITDRDRRPPPIWNVRQRRYRTSTLCVGTGT